MVGKKVAFVVSEPNKNLYEEISEVASLLASRGIVCESPCFSDDSVEWKKYDLISFNSCDGYYKQPHEFRTFLQKILPLQQKIFNPVPVISWNMEKNYLIDLANAGFSVAETIWVKYGEKIDLENEIKKRGWQKFIIKPSLSAGSFNTAVFEQKDFAAAQIHLQKVCENSTAMIQEFMPQVVETGEYSAFFFDKKFSHLILKTPAKGDFRAGVRQGASVQMLDSAHYTDLVELAQKLVNHIPEKLLYARVDMALAEKIYIMELELIEPLLYLQFGEGLVEKYAQQIIETLRKNDR